MVEFSEDCSPRRFQPSISGRISAASLKSSEPHAPYLSAEPVPLQEMKRPQLWQSPSRHSRVFPAPDTPNTWLKGKLENRLQERHEKNHEHDSFGEDELHTPLINIRPQSMQEKLRSGQRTIPGTDTCNSGFTESRYGSNAP